jgi:hypothetical protein
MGEAVVIVVAWGSALGWRRYHRGSLNAWSYLLKAGERGGTGQPDFRATGDLDDQKHCRCPGPVVDGLSIGTLIAPADQLAGAIGEFALTGRY